MQKNLNIEKIIFKVVQMKFLAMHITNQKLSFDIFMVGNLLNIFMEHDLNILMIFGIKEKCIILTTYNVLLSIATNIPVLLMTAFVLQRHRGVSGVVYRSCRCTQFFTLLLLSSVFVSVLMQQRFCTVDVSVFSCYT